MANYGIIHANITVTDARDHLVAVCAALFGERITVSEAPWDSAVLLVQVPSVVPENHEEARRLWLAFGEPAGFAVEVDDGQLAFRHGPNPGWLRWVQGCIEEEMSDRLGLPVVYDATDRPVGPGARFYRTAPGYREHMLLRVGRTEEDLASLKPHLDITPAEFM